MDAADFDRLVALIGLPSVPYTAVDWNAERCRLGIELPDDYRAFVETYGSVLIQGWLQIDALVGDCRSWLDTQHDILRALRALNPPAHPYAFFPEANGLLVWALSSDGMLLLWDTSMSMEPNQWPTMLFRQDGDNGTWERVNARMVDVMLGLLEGTIAGRPSSRSAGTSGECIGYPLVFSDPVADPTPQRRARDNDLHQAGVALAATIQSVGSEEDPGGSATGCRLPAAGPEPGCPADYHALLGRLGAGTLGGVLRLLGMGAPEPFDLDTERARKERELSAWRAAGRRVVPAPIAPAPAGLRLWAVFESGETCWWLPETGDPADWPVILVDADGAGWQRLECPTIEFLDSWLAGRLDLPVLGLPPVARNRTFTPVGLVMPGSDPTGEPILMRRDPKAQLVTIVGVGDPGQQRPYDLDAGARVLGLDKLPGDYRWLLQNYCDNPINQGIFVIEPDRLPEFQEELSGYAKDSFRMNDDGSLPVYPEPGGLLVCATTESSGELWWDTTDPDPDRWTIIWDLAFGRHRFPGGLVELIVADLTGTLENPLTGLHPAMRNPRIY